MTSFCRCYFQYPTPTVKSYHVLGNQRSSKSICTKQSTKTSLCRRTWSRFCRGGASRWRTIPHWWTGFRPRWWSLCRRWSSWRWWARFAPWRWTSSRRPASRSRWRFGVTSASWGPWPRSWPPSPWIPGISSIVSVTVTGAFSAVSSKRRTPTVIVTWPAIFCFLYSQVTTIKSCTIHFIHSIFSVPPFVEPNKCKAPTFLRSAILRNIHVTYFAIFREKLLQILSFRTVSQVIYFQWYHIIGIRRWPAVSWHFAYNFW